MNIIGKIIPTLNALNQIDIFNSNVVTLLLDHCQENPFYQKNTSMREGLQPHLINGPTRERWRDVKKDRKRWIKWVSKKFTMQSVVSFKMWWDCQSPEKCLIPKSNGIDLALICDNLWFGGRVPSIFATSQLRSDYFLIWVFLKTKSWNSLTIYNISFWVHSYLRFQNNRLTS